MQYIIKGETTIHFKTGAALSGDLTDFVFAEDSKAIIKLISNKEKMSEIKDKDIAIINLSEVVFLDLKHIRVLTND